MRARANFFLVKCHTTIVLGKEKEMGQIINISRDLGRRYASWEICEGHTIPTRNDNNCIRKDEQLAPQGTFVGKSFRSEFSIYGEVSVMTISGVMISYERIHCFLQTMS